MIEAVLFDFGGVITTSPFEKFAAYEAEAALPAGLIRQINSTDPDSNAWAKLERAEVDRQGFVELFEAEARSLGYAVSADRVLGCLETELRPAMVEAVRRLSGTYKTAVLTNNLLGASKDGRRTATGDMEAVIGIVDVVVESSKTGLRKPEPEFYQLACAMLEVTAQQCVFLDDLGINLKPARAMGMTTIKVTSESQALDELQELVDVALR
ncbi:MAG: HAD-IA family hydrolase [Acidimicrobiales bacterium]